MYHIFLTGDIQVGKSTIINTFLDTKGLWPGGFLTVSGPHGPDGSSDVHIVATEGGQTLGPGNRVLARSGRHAAGGITVFTEVFETVGVALLTRVGTWDLIVMDELGTREIDATSFQQAVFSRLEGSLPVLGVLQNRPSPFLDRVRSHPKVEIYTVTVENRATVLAELNRCWRDGQWAVDSY